MTAKTENKLGSHRIMSDGMYTANLLYISKYLISSRL